MTEALSAYTTLSPGTVLAGRYRVDAVLGAGGMGAVYRAYDTKMDRDVAIKVLKEAKRLAKEASATAQLTHPNIVKILTTESDDSPHPFLVLEYVEGRTLRSIVEEDGLLSPERAKEIMQQVLDAATHAHSHGIIHRDLKPQNIMLDKHGSVKVLDFGLAKLMGIEEQRLTQTGEIVGTPEYIAPEQCVGEAITPQTDIYQLGCCLHFMLTGKAPFSGETVMETFLKHVHEQPDLTQIADAHLASVIGKALAKAPTDRYQSAEDMRAALFSTAPAPAPAPLLQTAHSKRLPPYAVRLLAALVTGIVITAAMSVRLPHQQPPDDFVTPIKEITQRIHDHTSKPDDLASLKRLEPLLYKPGVSFNNRLQYENAVTALMYRNRDWDGFFKHARQLLEIKVEPTTNDHFDYGTYNLLMALLDEHNRPDEALAVAKWVNASKDKASIKYATWALRAADYDVLHIAKKHNMTEVFNETEARLAQGKYEDVEQDDLAVLHVALRGAGDAENELDGSSTYRSPVGYYLEAPHSKDYPGLRAHACVTLGLDLLRDGEGDLAAERFRQAIAEGEIGLREKKEVSLCEEAIADAELNLQGGKPTPIPRKPDTQLDVNRSNSLSPFKYRMRHYHL